MLTSRGGSPCIARTLVSAESHHPALNFQARRPADLKASTLSLRRPDSVLSARTKTGMAGQASISRVSRRDQEAKLLKNPELRRSRYIMSAPKAVQKMHTNR